MEKDTDASLNFSVHDAQYPRAHFLLTLFIQSSGCRNFRPGASHASYACGPTATKNLLASSAVEFSIQFTVTRFFFLLFKHSFTSREHISVLFFFLPGKIKFFSKWNPIERRKRRNRGIVIAHGSLYANMTKR